MLVKTNQGHNYLDKIELIIVYVITFLIPFGGFPSITTIPLLTITWCIIIIRRLFLRKNYFPNGFKTYKILCLNILILFIWFTIGLLYTKNIIEGWITIQHKLSFLLFPFIFLFSGIHIHIKKGKILKIFLISNCIVSIICLVNAFLNSIYFNELGDLKFSASVIDRSYPFIYSITHGGNYFFYSDLSIFLLNTYFSITILLSIVITYYLLKNKELSPAKGIAISLFLTLMLYLLSSRATIISFLVILLVTFAIQLISLKKLKVKVTLTFMVGILVYLGISNSRFIDINFNELKKSSLQEIQNVYGTEIRIMMFRSGLEIINENRILGVGTGDANAELHKVYKKYKLEEPSIRYQNSHNQLLQIFISNGIIGLSIYLFFTILLLFYSIQTKNILLLSLLIIILINGSFEVLLDRFQGALLIGYFVGLFGFILSPLHGRKMR